MKQQTITDIEYAGRKRKTKREEFLDLMDNIIDWDVWEAIIKDHYPKGERGRPPRGIITMLKMYLLQNWFGLSDEGVEDAIYDSYAMRKFMGLNFLEEQVPDATTLLKFRHLLEEHELGKQLFDSITGFLDNNGRIMRGGTIVDATIISASSSTKNAKGQRDPEMHQTKKGNQFYHGMKAHIGVDAGTGYVHTVTATAANAHDITETHNLIREDDHVVYGDAGYIGIEKREEIKKSEHLSSIKYNIAKRPGVVRAMSARVLSFDREIEYRKASIRSKVEHPFHIIKNTFGYRKAVYKGLKKNLNRLHILFGSANLLMLARSGALKA
jgi:IS5 family transposase